MQTTSQLSKELNEKYEAARTYYEADQREKAAKGDKKAVRNRLIQLWGTGKNRLADLEVNFSSHNRTNLDREALEAFLAEHGKTMDDFTHYVKGERLTVNRV